MSPPIGASYIHIIGFGWPVAVPLTLPFSSVGVRLGPVPAGPVYSCVGAAGRFAAVCCVRGGVFRGIKSSSSLRSMCGVWQEADVAPLLVVYPCATLMWVYVYYVLLLCLCFCRVYNIIYIYIYIYIYMKYILFFFYS